MKHPHLIRRECIEQLECRSLLAVATVDFAATRQTMEGNGAAMIAWVGHNELPEYAQASFYDQLVNDLGASAARAPIWPNFEQANDNSDPNFYDWSKFSSVQLQNVMTFFQRMKERGVKTFLLTAWTPPYWMKTNLSLQAGGSLRPDMRAEYAEFLSAVVIAAKRDFDIDITGVSIQNEPFFNEWYESAVMDNIGLRDTTIAVQEKFKREGIKVKVLANEDLGNNDAHRWKWYNDALLADPQIDRSNLIIGSHTSTPTGMAAQAAQLQGTGLPLWYTEAAGRPLDWWNSLMVAADASDAFTQANASAYFFWQYSDGSSAQTGSLMQHGVPNSKYNTIKHIYKYIQPGMQRVQTSIDDSLTRIGAYKDPTTGAQTMTLMNVSDFNKTFTINVSNFAPGSTFRVFRSTISTTWETMPSISAAGTITITVPALSIYTLYSGQDKPLVSGQGTPVEPPIFPIADAVQQNPLRKAAARGELTNVQNLIASGVNVNEIDPTTGWTALHAAAASPISTAKAIITALLAAGANPLATTFRGETPLHAVAMNLWQEWQEDRNVVAQQNIDKMDLLINAGVNVNAVDAQGRTALHWAAWLPNMYNEYGHNNQPVGYLESRGVNRAILDNFGRSAYDYATLDFRQEYLDVLRWPAPYYDTRGPLTRFAKYNVDKNQIDLTFTENITASLVAGDITIRNIANNQLVTGWTLSSVFENGISVAKVTFPARLPNGRYRLTLATGAIADQNNVASISATTVDFAVKAGDVTGDGAVSFDDLLIVAQNYGKSNRVWSQGDFNGDGVVNFDDLLVLAQNYGTSVLADTQATPTTTTPAASKIPVGSSALAVSTTGFSASKSRIQ